MRKRWQRILLFNSHRFEPYYCSNLENPFTDYHVRIRAVVSGLNYTVCRLRSLVELRSLQVYEWKCRRAIRMATVCFSSNNVSYLVVGWHSKISCFVAFNTVHDTHRRIAIRIKRNQFQNIFQYFSCTSKYSYGYFCNSMRCYWIRWEIPIRNYNPITMTHLR